MLQKGKRNVSMSVNTLYINPVEVPCHENHLTVYIHDHALNCYQALLLVNIAEILDKLIRPRGDAA